MGFFEKLNDFLKTTGFYMIFSDFAAGGWKNLVMIALSCFLLWLAIKKKFEPLLLIGIAFGMLLTNLPGAEMYHGDLWSSFMKHEIGYGEILLKGGLLDYLYIGVKTCIYPCLIFIGIGAMTDFGPLISNPKSLLLGAAAQIGIFVTFIGCFYLGFPQEAAASIGIIGGADGPTAIYTTSTLYPNLLGPIAVAAYSYMALVPIIQPPVIKLLTTKKERLIRMPYQEKSVSKTTKILFPIIITMITGIVSPRSVALIGFLMFGNLLRECGVLDSLSETAQKVLSNLVTILLGITIATKMQAEYFLTKETLIIIALGLVAFIFDTAGGVIIAKLINLFLPKDKKINPMIGAAGISAFPMSARVVHKMGLKEDPQNFLLMHSIGVNVSGQIASVIAGGLLLTLLG